MKGIILGCALICMTMGCTTQHGAAKAAATTTSILLDETSSQDASRDTENFFLDMFGWNDTPKSNLKPGQYSKGVNTGEN